MFYNLKYCIKNHNHSYLISLGDEIYSEVVNINFILSLSSLKEKSIVDKRFAVVTLSNNTTYHITEKTYFDLINYINNIGR